MVNEDIDEERLAREYQDYRYREAAEKLAYALNEATDIGAEFIAQSGPHTWSTLDHVVIGPYHIEEEFNQAQGRWTGVWVVVDHG